MKRIQSFDLARGFTVLIMPSIHVIMLYSIPSVQQSFLGDVLAFIAEGPGAQLFMLLMGVGFTLSSKINKKSVFKRALLLLVAAYGLNFLKFIVPLGLGLMPPNLLAELQQDDNYTSVPFFLLLGDILHFAMIAYLPLYLVYRLPRYYYWSLCLAILIIFISPMVWDLQTGIGALDYILQLLGGHPPVAFFPVFPWLVYPLIGMTLGFLLKKFDQNMVIKMAGWFGLAIIIFSFSFPATTEPTDWLPFYRTWPADTIFHLGFVLVWLAVIHWLSKKIKFNPFSKLLEFCSKNITSIYLIQWVLICWCLALTGYLQLNMMKSFCWMIGITTFTLLLTYAIKKSNAQPKNI